MTKKSTGIFGIDANNQKATTDKAKRKPKFAHGADLKKSVE